MTAEERKHQATTEKFKNPKTLEDYLQGRSMHLADSHLREVVRACNFGLHSSSFLNTLHPLEKTAVLLSYEAVHWTGDLQESCFAQALALIVLKRISEMNLTPKPSTYDIFLQSSVGTQQSKRGVALADMPVFRRNTWCYNEVGRSPVQARPGVSLKFMQVLEDLGLCLPFYTTWGSLPLARQSLVMPNPNIEEQKAYLKNVSWHTTWARNKVFMHNWPQKVEELALKQSLENM